MKIMYYEHTCYDGEAECTFTFEAETGTLTGAYVWSRDLDGEPGGFDPAGFEGGGNQAFAHARPETLPQLVQRFRRWHGELGDDCPPCRGGVVHPQGRPMPGMRRFRGSNL